MLSFVITATFLASAFADSSSEEEFPVYQRIVKPTPEWPAKGTLTGQYDFPHADELGEFKFCIDTAQEKLAKIFWDKTEVKSNLLFLIFLRINIDACHLLCVVLLLVGAECVR